MFNKLVQPDSYELAAFPKGRDRFFVFYSETFRNRRVVENTYKALRRVPEMLVPGAKLSRRSNRISMTFHVTRKELADMMVSEFMATSSLGETTLGTLYQTVILAVANGWAPPPARKKSRR